jgi:hypothetical protein
VVIGNPAQSFPITFADVEILGENPKPASRDHLKTGQLQTSNQDKIVVPYLESSSKFFPIVGRQKAVGLRNE